MPPASPGWLGSEGRAWCVLAVSVRTYHGCVTSKSQISAPPRGPTLAAAGDCCAPHSDCPSGSRSAPGTPTPPSASSLQMGLCGGRSGRGRPLSAGGQSVGCAHPGGMKGTLRTQASLCPCGGAWVGLHKQVPARAGMVLLTALPPPPPMPRPRRPPNTGFVKL